MKKRIFEGKPINRALQTRAEIDQCTALLQQYEAQEHPIGCKNWDISLILPRLVDGTMLDMGCSGGSVILENALRFGVEGRKIGIDYTLDTAPVEGIEKMVMDLMHTTFENNYFQTLFCLSVLEHAVDYHELARECSRLLKTGGELWITHDYFDPKPSTEGMKLYSLSWDILDRKDVERLIEEMKSVGLNISSPVDFTTTEAVINPTYCSPAPVSYSFMILHFIKA